MLVSLSHQLKKINVKIKKLVTNVILIKYVQQMARSSSVKKSQQKLNLNASLHVKKMKNVTVKMTSANVKLKTSQLKNASVMKLSL